MSRRLDIALAAVLGGQLAAAALLTRRGELLLMPNDAPVSSACVSRGLSGIECPFCGMSRSFVATIHGDLGAAFSLHPAGPLLCAFFAIAVTGVLVLWAMRARPLSERRLFLRALAGMALLSVAAGAFKIVFI